MAISGNKILDSGNKSFGQQTTISKRQKKQTYGNAMIGEYTILKQLKKKWRIQDLGTVKDTKQNSASNSNAFKQKICNIS